MIEPIATPGPLAPAKPRARAGERFLPPQVEQDAGVSVEEATPVSLVGMLAMQEAGADAARDREARRHGEEMLQELADLQRALLGSGVSAAGLANLADLASRARPAADNGLRGVLDAIGLRAQVELARYDIDLKRSHS
jgi:hypothetical protein